MPVSFNLNGINMCFILFNPARIYEVIAIGTAILSILKCIFLGLVRLTETRQLDSFRYTR